MTTGLLFVTAPEADHRQINRILLRLRVWDTDPDAMDTYKLVTTKNAYDLEPPACSDGWLPATSPPLDAAVWDNAWAGASLEDVEAFCLDLHRAPPRSVETLQFLLVDSEGLRAGDCILGHRRGNDLEAGEFAYLDEFDKMRIPQDQVYTVWANFVVGNMQWFEFTQEMEDWGVDDEGRLNRGGEDGWFTYREIGGCQLSDEQRRRKAGEMERFEREGWI